MELALEVGIAHRPLQAADRMLDLEVQAAAVAAADRHVGRGFVDRRVDLRMDSIAKRDDIEATVNELRVKGGQFRDPIEGRE